MLNALIEHMKKTEGVTEKLKEYNQMEWMCRMGCIEVRAREIINNEIIFK